MTSRNTRLVAAIAVVSIAIVSAFVLLGRRKVDSRVSAFVESSGEHVDENNDVGRETENDVLLTQNLSKDPTQIVPADGAIDDQEVSSTTYSGDENGNWQRNLVRGDSVLGMQVVELVSDENFDELVAQLREESNDIASDKRSMYQAAFYSHPSSQDGSVALDMLECGSVLCAAEVRATDGALLDQYIEEVTGSDEFQSGAIAQLPGSEISSYGQSRRLVFPHSPAVSGLTLPTSRHFLDGAATTSISFHWKCEANSSGRAGQKKAVWVAGRRFTRVCAVNCVSASS